MINIYRRDDHWIVETPNNKDHCYSIDEVLASVRGALHSTMRDEEYQRDLEAAFTPSVSDNQLSSLAEEDAALDALEARGIGQMVSVAQLAERAGVRREYVLAEIKRGNITAHKIGRSYAIPEWAVWDWLAKPRRGSRRKVQA